jgi:hypothetical protein
VIREWWRVDSKEDFWCGVRVLEGIEEKGLLSEIKVRVFLNIRETRDRLRLRLFVIAKSFYMS